jgi:hypothetical protein
MIKVNLNPLLRNLKFRYLTLCFAILIVGCKKNELIRTPVQAKQVVDNLPENQKISIFEVSEWVSKLPSELPFNVDWSKAEQTVIDGRHVVRAPITQNSYLIFYKEPNDTALKVYAYAFAPDSKDSKGLNGGVVAFDFQNYQLSGEVFKDGKPLGKKIFTSNYDEKALSSFQSQVRLSTGNRLRTNSIFGDIFHTIGNLFGALGCAMTGGSWENGPGGSWSDNTYGNWNQSCSGQFWTWDWSFNNGYNVNDANAGMPNFLLSVYDASSGMTYTFDKDHMNPSSPATATGGGGGGGVNSYYDYPTADRITAAAGLTLNERNFLVSHYTILFALNGFWDEAERHRNVYQIFTHDKIMDIIKKHVGLLMSDNNYLNWYYTFRGPVNDYNGNFALWDVTIPYMVDFLDDPAHAQFANSSGYLGLLGLESDPTANITGETNDETLGGYDQTNYGAYQQNSIWPTVAPVIAPTKFISFDGGNCLTLSKKQLAEANYQISGYDVPGQTYNINTVPGGINIPEAKNAVGYMRGALQAGIPVLVGIDYMNGVPIRKDGTAANLDLKTDHFIVIVGMGTDAKGKYFRFYDNATSARQIGTSENNRLYYNETTGVISGTTEVAFENARRNNVPQYRDANGKVIYTITHIRRSKVKP